MDYDTADVVVEKAAEPLREIAAVLRDLVELGKQALARDVRIGEAGIEGGPSPDDRIAALEIAQRARGQQLAEVMALVIEQATHLERVDATLQRVLNALPAIRAQVEQAERQAGGPG